MEHFVFRNSTVEYLFSKYDCLYSAYGDISFPVEDVDAYIWFYLPSIKMSRSELIEETQDFLNKFNLVYSQIPKAKNCIAFTLSKTLHFKFENSDFQLEASIDEFNSNLYKLARENVNLKIIEFSEFIAKTDNKIVDWKHYYISSTFINIRLSNKFSEWFTAKLNAISSKRKKCLILDLDNTLWGGIIGEDGIDGIKIGDTYPGNAFSDFQQNILEASKNGVILAVCSKNNADDVWEVFKNHPFQIIKENNLAAYRINWTDKPTNIQELADELNIGLDSMVFLDDNPVERQRVKEFLPEVAVPDFPDHPYLLSTFFFEVYEKYFQIYSLTKEDKNKTEQYLSNAERNVHKKNFGSIDEYLGSLDMQIEIYEANPLIIPRIVQMLNKTNQFNLTTKRYDEKDINRLLADNALINAVSIRDKFGDNGITVASIILVKDGEAEIDSYLLSCRILGRNIEFAYVDFLLNQLYDKNVKTVWASYIPTKKNKQTENFYNKLGFTEYEITADGVKRYKLDLLEKREIKPYFKFIIQ